MTASAAKSPNDIVVGLTYGVSADSRDGAGLSHYVQMHAAKQGLKLVDLSASTPEGQVRSIARLRAQRVDALIVVALAPANSALIGALAACREDGIPVVVLTSPDEGGAPVGSLYSAELEAQAALARYVFERVGGRGKVVYLHADGLPADAPQRRGLQTALGAFPDIELVPRSVNSAGPAADAALPILNEQRDAVAIIGASDALALSATRAFAASGLSRNRLVAGFGGSPNGLAAIEHGDLDVTVRLDYDRLAVVALCAALRTVVPGPRTEEASAMFELVTRDNLARVAVHAMGVEVELTRDMARRNAEARKVSEFLDSVIDTIPLNLFVKDATDLRLIRINKAREEWFGIRREDQLGKSARDLYPVELAERFEASDRRVLAGVPDLDLPQDQEHSTESPKGPRYVQTRKCPIYADDGSPAYLVGVSFDTTERKLAQLALAQRNVDLEAAQVTMQRQQTKLLIAEKMASLGRLTAGIAHEMNSPLAAVRAAMSELSALVDEYAAGIGDAALSSDDHAHIAGDMKRTIDLAEKSAARAAAFVRGIKTQTRSGDPQQRSTFNAVPVIQESLLLLSHLLRGNKCTARFMCSSFEGTVDNVVLFGSPARLAQVVTNLVTNAIDASKTKGGGEILVELVASGERRSLRVVDHGTGIPPEIVAKIFDPLFTTKPFGQGTGLGLSIVHDIIASEFGGTVEVHSAPGEGTTFELFFGPEVLVESTNEEPRDGS